MDSRSVIARFSVPPGDAPFRHPAIWAREAPPDSSSDRLCIGGGKDPVELLLALALVLTEPLWLLSVVRRYEGAGKYEAQALTRADVTSFVDEFGELFSVLGTADLWVGSMQAEGLVVLDEHDLLYAYGPLDDFEGVLRDRGFMAGLPELPFPHSHSANADLAEELLRLREWPGWARVLPPDDDDEFIPLSANREEAFGEGCNVVAAVVGSHLQLVCPECSTSAFRDWAALSAIGRSEAICAECGQMMAFLIPASDSRG